MIIDAADMENFVINLTDAAKTHEEWLNIMRFGLKNLIELPLLLFECIIREASRDRTESKVNYRVIADDAVRILNELGLKLTT